MNTEIANSVVGLIVSNPWKGYGSMVYLELGALTPNHAEPNRQPQGEASISIGYIWRIVSQGCVVLSSEFSNPKISTGLAQLVGTRVEYVQTVSVLGELIIGLSNGFEIRTLIMSGTKNEWHVRLQDASYISIKDGLVTRSDGSRNDGEDDDFDNHEQVALRWGKPLVEPAKGKCINCKYMFRIDGDYYLLDYGICICVNSSLDGRAIKVSSGCPNFEPD